MTHKESPTDLAPEVTATELEKDLGAAATGIDPAGVAALALGAAAAEPAVREPLSGFLREQQELARRQRLLADRQSALLEKRIARDGLERAHLEAQNHHLRLQHVHDRMRLVLDAGLAALGLALLVGIAWSVYSAVTDRSIVVNAFTVAPNLEKSGTSGAAVATQFLDELIQLRESARADIAKRAVIDSLAEQVQIEVPEVHVSYGELRRVLHETLGHRTQIRGEVNESPDGLALTVRATSLPTRTFTGKADALPALVTQAAEYAYGHTDPVQMAYYLQRASRPEEAVALIRKRFAAEPPEVQAQMLNVWGNVLANVDSLPQAFAKYRAAIGLNPKFWYPYFNLVNFGAASGGEEEAVKVSREFEHAARRGRWFGLPAVDSLFVNVDELRLDVPLMIQESLMDYDVTSGLGSTGFPAGAVIAQYYGLQHDPAAAELILETNPDAAGEQKSILGVSAPIEEAAARGVIEFEAGHYPEAARHWADWDRLISNASQKDLPYRIEYRRQRCWLPIAYEMAGRREDADAALLATQPLNQADCYRFRADVYDHRGAWDQAQSTYAQGVARVPSLPHVYLGWGKALLGHQQYQAAIEKLAAAHQRGPHWADPLKFWGDALVGLGKKSEALAKYDEALRYAPKWDQLISARATLVKPHD